MVKDQNSLRTALRWSWNAAVGASAACLAADTIGEITRTWRKDPPEDVDQIVHHNQFVLRMLTRQLNRFAELQAKEESGEPVYNDLWSNAGETGLLIGSGVLDELERILGEFRYPERELQSLMAKVRRLITKKRAVLQKVEQEQLQREEAERRQRWTTYRQANGYGDGRLWDQAFLISLVLWVALWLWVQSLE